MKKHCVILILFICYTIAPALAISGTTLDPSNNLYTARQLGMGGVSVAFSDDANGIFSNPAGIANAQFPQLTGSSRKLVLDETQYTLFGWAVPTDFGTFGFGYTGMNTGDSLPTKIDPASSRIVIDPSREATSYGNSLTAISYSKQIASWISLGGSYKIFNQALSGDTASSGTATGYDIGLILKPQTWLTLGTNLQNISGANLLWDNGVSDAIGGYYKLGCKLNLFGAPGKSLTGRGPDFAIGIDYNTPHNTLSSATSYNIGCEYFPLEKIALRSGLNQDGYSMGIGLVNGGFRFDYAYAANPNIPGDTPHYFTLSYIGERVYTFTRSLKKKKAQIVFSQPKDRLITDKQKAIISAEAVATRILDHKSVWTVTGISDTQEVKQVTESENLVNVSLNGKFVGNGKAGNIDSIIPIRMGRNVIQIIGYTSPESITGLTSPEEISAEIKVMGFAPFIDTPMTYWAIEPIALSATLGLVKGYKDDSFKPEKGITRAELITLLVRSLSIKEDDLFGFTPFSDVSTNHWAAKYIGYGVDINVVTGYPDDTFKPNKVLTRAEGITILARYAGLSEEAEAEPIFPDLQSGYWANKYITPANKAGFLKYLEGKDFDPSAPFTRAEACEVLYRTPSIQNKVDQWWETGTVSAQQPEQPKPAEELIPTVPATSESE